MNMTMDSSTAALAGSRAFLTVGLDVGGTKTACVVTDADDQIVLHHVVPTDPTRLPHHLTELIRDAVNNAGASVGAVGVAVPGHVEPESGTIRLAVNLGGGGEM